MRKLLGVVGTAVLAAACGGIAQTGSGGTPFGDVDGGVVQGGQGSAGGASNGGQAQGGQTSSGSGGVGGAFSCDETHDVATIDEWAVGTFSDPDGGVQGGLSFDGSVGDVSADRFILDTAQDELMFTVDAKGLDLTQTRLSLGGFVHVHYVNRCTASGVCAHDIVVASLPTWQGEPNPRPAASGFYVIAHDGGGAPLSDAPFTVDHVPLSECAGSDRGCGGEVQGPYFLRFIAPAIGSTVDVPMGDSEWLQVNEKNGGLLVHNLRSFENGATCDDGSNWAYWAIDHAQPL